MDANPEQWLRIHLLVSALHYEDLLWESTTFLYKDFGFFFWCQKNGTTSNVFLSAVKVFISKQHLISQTTALAALPWVHSLVIRHIFRDLMRKTRSVTRRWPSVLPSFLPFSKACVCPAAPRLLSLLNRANKGEGAEKGFYLFLLLFDVKL